MPGTGGQNRRFAVEVLAIGHMLFRREYSQLLKAQVILYDMTQKLAQAQADANTRFAELTLAQKHTDERLSALIAVVDSLVRRPPVQ